MSLKSRKPRKPALALTTVAHKRFSYQVRSGCDSRAGKIAFKAFNDAPVFDEDADGHLIRQWRPEELQRYTTSDIVQALRGRHVVETEDMLEYIPPSAIKYCVSKGWLHPESKWFRVTRKAAAELKLPRTVGGRKIHFFDNGLI